MIDPPTFATKTSRVWFIQTGADTDGERHEQRVEYAPNSQFPPKHYHSSQDEHFEVESGQMLVVVDGEETLVSAGETIDITRGTAHTMRNPSTDEPALVLWVTQPALRTAEFHLAVAGLSARSSLLDRAVFAHEFRDVFRLAGIPGLLLPVVAGLARLLGKGIPPVALGGFSDR